MAPVCKFTFELLQIRSVAFLWCISQAASAGPRDRAGVELQEDGELDTAPRVLLPRPLGFLRGMNRWLSPASPPCLGGDARPRSALLASPLCRLGNTGSGRRAGFSLAWALKSQGHRGNGQFPAGHTLSCKAPLFSWHSVTSSPSPPVLSLVAACRACRRPFCPYRGGRSSGRAHGRSRGRAVGSVAGGVGCGLVVRVGSCSLSLLVRRVMASIGHPQT